MGAVLLLLLQAAAGSPPQRIDLLQPAVSPGCENPIGDAIVVCARRADPYRLLPLKPRPEAPAVPKAETGLFGGGAMGAVEAEAATMPGGVQSNRLMARIKVPF